MTVSGCSWAVTEIVPDTLEGTGASSSLSDYPRLIFEVKKSAKCLVFGALSYKASMLFFRLYILPVRNICG